MLPYYAAWTSTLYARCNVTCPPQRPDQGRCMADLGSSRAKGGCGNAAHAKCSSDPECTMGMGRDRKDLNAMGQKRLS